MKKLRRPPTLPTTARRKSKPSSFFPNLTPPLPSAGAAGTAPGTRPTKSASSILSHSYSPETEQLTVTFRGGRKYIYAGISQALASRMDRADSKGIFLHKHVIGKFDATRVEKEKDQ